MAVTSQPTSLPTQSFSTIVQNITAGVQGRASALINFAIGSTLRAIAEAYASIFLWFQTLVLQLLTATRLATSQGYDVDTFTADFMPVIAGSQTAALPNGSPRLGAQFATGAVTFSRQTAAPTTCFIPAFNVATGGALINAGPNNGITLQTADGSQQFGVIANTANPAYSAALGGYTLPSSVQTVSCSVQAVNAGSGGNVVAGAITTVIGASPVGIDTVTNAAGFTNGANQESDSALKTRFANYILGLARGDLYGTTAAIEGGAVNVQFAITEGYNLDGSYHAGYYFIVVDDGSGSPSAAFLATMAAAAQSVRPLGIMCSVFAPTVIDAVPSMTIAVAPGYVLATIEAQVSALIAGNIDALGLGNSLEYGMLYSWAYSVPGVTNVTAVLLNGQSGDAASLLATKMSLDETTVIPYATIKCPGGVTVN